MADWVRFSDDDGVTWRELPDNDTTWNYLGKLSYSHRVDVQIDGKEFFLECGKTGKFTKRGA